MEVKVTYINEVGGTIGDIELWVETPYSTIFSCKTWHKGYAVEGNTLYLDMDRRFVKDLLYTTMVTDVRNYLLTKKV